MGSDHLRPAPSPSEAIAAFRGGSRRSPLHPQERWLLVVLGATVVSATWLAGGPAWLEFLPLLCAGGALALSLPPRPIVEGLEAVDWSSRWRFKRLLRFPGFWLGLAAVAFVAVQAARPVATANFDPLLQRWLLTPPAPAGAGPVSIAAPFAEMDAGRGVLALATAWLAGCAAWIGLTRRRSILAFFWIVVLNALGLAVVGMVQSFGGATSILGLWEPVDGRLAATFAEPHAAGAFFNLCAALALGMAVNHFFEGRRFLERSDPSALFLIAGVAIAMMACLSGSAAAFQLCVALAGFFGGFVLFTVVWRNEAGLARAVGIAVIATCTLVPAWVAGQFLDWSFFSGLRVVDRLPATHAPAAVASIDEAARARFQERPVFGWGWGSFRYVAPDRQDAAAEIAATGEPVLHDRARGDVRHFPVELGLSGCALLLAAAGWHLWSLATGRLWQNPLLLFTTFGHALALIQGWRATVFAESALLLVWSLLLTCTHLLSVMERPTRFRAPPSPTASTRPAFGRRA